MLLSIVIKLAAPENSGETHPSFQHMYELRERHKKITSIHMLITVFVLTVNLKDKLDLNAAYY